ncbi:MAG: 30S ribosomal protein S6 [Deltaproteobacteria bacterium]|nr:30S ribosomal protein S6 [Deltaproteobacteria bacterium]
MRRYETIYILRPDLPEDEIEALCQRLTKVITDHGGKVLSEDRWGLRTLAYIVKKHRKGYYVLLDYVAKSDALAELERTFKMIENVIRFFSMLKQTDVDPAALEEMMKQKPKKPSPPVVEEGTPSKEPAEAQSEAREDEEEEEEPDESESDEHEELEPVEEGA